MSGLSTFTAFINDKVNENETQKQQNENNKGSLSIWSADWARGCTIDDVRAIMLSCDLPCFVFEAEDGLTYGLELQRRRYTGERHIVRQELEGDYLAACLDE